jgi:hypothetical protein
VVAVASLDSTGVVAVASLDSTVVVAVASLDSTGVVAVASLDLLVLLTRGYNIQTLEWRHPAT